MLLLKIFFIFSTAVCSAPFHGVFGLGEHEFEGHVKECKDARSQENSYDATDISEEAIQFNGVELGADCDLGRRKEESQS